MSSDRSDRPDKRASTPTTFRLDDDVRVLLENYARDTRRTLNAAINYLLPRAIEAEGK